MHGDAADKRKRAADRQRRSRERKAAEAATEAANESIGNTERDTSDRASEAAGDVAEAEAEGIDDADVTHLVTRDSPSTSRVTSRARHTAKEKRREETKEENKNFGGGRDTSHALVVRGDGSPPAGATAQHDAGTPGKPVTAQTLVGEWLDLVPKRPPQKVIGQTSKELKQLLEDGIDPDDIRAGVTSWARKGLHPSTLPSEVNAVMNTNVYQLPTGQTFAATGTDATVAGWAAISQQVAIPENR
jgi:hypothetical protein